MEDSNHIEEIIESFRFLLDHIFDSTKRRDLIRMVFTPGYEELVDKRIQEYFEEEYQKLPADQERIERMKEGINYLMEKIRVSSELMRVLLYMALFSEKETYLQEVKTIFDL